MAEDGWPYALALDSQRRLLMGIGSANEKLSVARVAQPGGLDPTFGVDGRSSVLAPLATTLSRIMSVMVASDDSVIAYGQIRDAGLYEQEVTLLRMDQDGILVSDFGDAGRVVVAPSATGATAVLQDDEKIVVWYLLNGGSDRAEIVRRFHLDGSEDGSFGNEGQVVLEGSDVDRMVIDRVGGALILIGYAGDGEGGVFPRIQRMWL
jgi:hypothetical protein